MAPTNFRLGYLTSGCVARKEIRQGYRPTVSRRGLRSARGRRVVAQRQAQALRCAKRRAEPDNGRGRLVLAVVASFGRRREEVVQHPREALPGGVADKIRVL